MTKVAEIVRDALEYLTVLDGQATPTAEDMAVGVRQLNMMMRRWEANLLSLGWSDVTGPDDDLPVPPEAEEAVGYNLALRLRSRYGIPLADIADVVKMASDGYGRLLRDQEVATPIQPILDAPEPDYWGADRFRSTAWDY